MRKTVYRFLCMALTLCMLCTMTVITASATETAEVTVVYGTAYKMPSTVGAVTDIEWDGSVDATKFGAQTITGTGTGGSVTLTANIAAPKVVYKNNFDSYPTGAGASYYESADKFLKLYADAGVDGNTIVEETDGNKYFKAGPSTTMSMYSILRPQGTMDGKVAMRFRFRGVDLKGEWKDIAKIVLRDAGGVDLGEIRLQGGSDGDAGTDAQKTRYLYVRYSSDGSTWNGGGYLASNFNNGDTGWVNVTLVVDQTAGTYSLYAENIVLFENIRFKGTSDETFEPNSKIVSQLCFTRRNMSGEGYMCVDDFMYLDVNDSALAYPESNEAVTSSVANAIMGEEYVLPATVGGIGVKWEESSVDTSSIGRQIVTGKNDFDQDVTLTVNVGAMLPVYENDLDDYNLGFVGDTNSNSVGTGLVIVDGKADYVEIVEDAENGGKMLKVGPAASGMQMENGFKSPVAVEGDTIVKLSLRGRDLKCEWQDVLKLQLYDSNGAMVANLKFQGGSDGLDGTNTGNSRHLYMYYGTAPDTYDSSNGKLLKTNFNNGDTGWFDLEIHFNQTDKNYDVVIGGEEIYSDIPTVAATPGNINKLSIHRRNLAGGGYFNVDNVKFYKDEIVSVASPMPTEAISTMVGLGTIAEPTAVSLAMSNGTTMEFPVTYAVDSSKPGYVTAVGTVDGFSEETVLINAKILSYKPVDFVFETSDGAASAEPASGGKLKSLGVKRYTASSDDAVIMVAIYDNGVLKTVKPADISGVQLGETQTIDLDIALPSDVSKLDIRTFVLDGKDTLKPIDLSEYWESAKKKQ